MAKSKPKPLPAGDFTADTPPPRVIPTGEPVPYWSRLPPGESGLGLFRGWEAAGRVPPGCVLAEFVGTLCVLHAECPKVSGYVVAGNPDGAAPLGPVGQAISPEARRRWRIVAHIDEYVGRPVGLCVLAPKG